MQKEYIGRNQIASLSLELSNIKPKKVLLVTGKKSFENCGARKILTPLLHEYELIEFSDFQPNPTFEDAIKGVDLCNNFSVDMIIAVGGGSCIDTAKSINAMYVHPGEELALVQGETKIYKKLVPLVAIPTTAGTGSEATHFSVIYLEGEKFSLASPKLIPSVAIVDPIFTDSLPPYITAVTGFDALCQSIESYWSKSATKESREYARQAIPLIVDNLLQAIKFASRESREKLILAANFSGKAINISKTTAPHALSYELASTSGLPHGHAVALTLGRFFLLHNDMIDRELKNTNLKEIMCDLYKLLDVTSGEQAYEFWYQFMTDCGLETNLNKIGLEATGIKRVIAKINTERLKNHPVKLSPQSLRKIFDFL